nr:hypothetical protein [Ralstonia mannitolilytica]
MTMALEKLDAEDWAKLIAIAKVAAPSPLISEWLESVSPSAAVSQWGEAAKLLNGVTMSADEWPLLANDPARVIPALVKCFVTSDSPDELPSMRELSVLLAILHLAQAEAHPQPLANEHLIAHGQAVAFALAFPFIDSLVYEKQQLTLALKKAKDKRAEKKVKLSQSKAKGGKAKNEKQHGEKYKLLEELFIKYYDSPEIAGNASKLADFIKINSNIGFRTQTIFKHILKLKKAHKLAQ